MSNVLRYILWSVFSLGMIVIAVMAFWVFLIIIGVIIIARFIYFKLFSKEPPGPKGTFTIHTYSMSSGQRNNVPPNQEPQSRDQEFTTVIDADDMNKEYKVPKIK